MKSKKAFNINQAYRDIEHEDYKAELNMLNDFFNSIDFDPRTKYGPRGLYTGVYNDNSCQNRIKAATSLLKTMGLEEAYDIYKGEKANEQ